MKVIYSAFLLILFFTSSLKAQVFSPASAHQKNDPIEKTKNDLVKQLFKDNRFVGGYLLYLSFYHDFNIQARENAQTRIYKPEVARKLLQYFFTSVDEVNDVIASNYFDRASARMDSSLYEQSMNDFDQVLMYDPRNTGAYINRGILFIISQQFPEALVELEKAKKLNPKNPEVLFNKGVVYYNMGDSDHALSLIDSALVLMPDFSRAHFEKGLIFGVRGDTDAAMKELRKARSLGDPDAGTLMRDLKQKEKDKKDSISSK